MPFSSAQYTELLASTREKLVTTDLVDQVFRTRPSLELFREAAKSYSGESLQVNVITSEASNAGWSDDSGTFSTAASTDIVKRAIYSWANPHIAPVRLPFTSLEKNSSPEAVFDLVTAHLNAAKEKVAKDMATALHSAAQVAGSNMETLHTVISSAGALGGIDPATVTPWKSTELVRDSDLVGILDAFREVLNDITVAGGEKPTDILAGIEIFEAYEKALEDKGRVIYAGDNNKVDGRFRELYYDGLRVVLDPDCAADTAFFVHRPSLVCGYLNDNFIKVAADQTVTGTMETITPIVSIPAFGTTARRNHGKLVWNAAGAEA